jgi:hypothetical protein
MWPKAPEERNLITPATSDLWQVGLTVLEMFSRRRPEHISDFAKVVLECVQRTPKADVLTMSRTEAENWLVSHLAFTQGTGISRLDGPRMLDLALGEIKSVKRELGFTTGSAGKFQRLIRRSVSSVADAVPPNHIVTDADGTFRTCGVGLLLLQSLHSDIVQRPSSPWAALQIMGAKAKLDSIDYSSATGFQVLPASVLDPADSHEDDDIESTYKGLISLLENTNEVGSAIASCANWLAMLSPHNVSARDRALNVYCDLLRRHADIVEDICLSPPSAHWRVENFDATCFERITSAMWSNFHPSRRLTSIDLSHLRLINTNVLNMLLCSPRKPTTQCSNPMSDMDDDNDSLFLGDGISSLIILNLQGCRVSGVVPRAGLAGCPRLRELDLGGCLFHGPKLHELMVALLPASKCLQKINLGLNKTGGRVPSAENVWREFTVLSDLRLYAMGLSGMYVTV